jgi:hypothetical protein
MKPVHRDNHNFAREGIEDCLGKGRLAGSRRADQSENVATSASGQLAQPAQITVFNHGHHPDIFSGVGSACIALADATLQPVFQNPDTSDAALRARRVQ